MVEGAESRVTRPQHSAARASKPQSLQGGGGVCLPLRGGEAVQSDGLCSVLRNTSAVLKHVAQVDLSACMPMCRCKTVESHGLGIVLRNTSPIINNVAQAKLSSRISLCR